MNFIDLKVIFQWQICLLFRKNTSYEITKTVKLKNVMLIVMKKISGSAKPMCKNISQVCKNTFKQIFLVLFQCFLKALEWHFYKVIFWTRDIFHWGFPDSPFQYRCYIQAVIVFQWFLLQLTQQASLCYFKKIYIYILDFYCIFPAAMICLPSKNFVHV